MIISKMIMKGKVAMMKHLKQSQRWSPCVHICEVHNKLYFSGLAPSSTIFSLGDTNQMSFDNSLHFRPLKSVSYKCEADLGQI